MFLLLFYCVYAGGPYVRQRVRFARRAAGPGLRCRLAVKERRLVSSLLSILSFFRLFHFLKTIFVSSPVTVFRAVLRTVPGIVYSSPFWNLIVVYRTRRCKPPPPLPGLFSMLDISIVGIVSVPRRSALAASLSESFPKTYRSVLALLVLLAPSWLSSNRTWKNRPRGGW